MSELTLGVISQGCPSLEVASLPGDYWPVLSCPDMLERAVQLFQLVHFPPCHIYN